jgi:hypothetical protein
MIENTILRRIQTSLNNSDRNIQRQINKALDTAQWVMAFPINECPTDEESDLGIYKQVYIFFGKSDKEPKFIPATRPQDIWEYEFDDTAAFEMDWPEVAVHMNGTVWFEASKVKQALLEPMSFDILDDSPVLSTSQNEILVEQIIEYLGGIPEFDYVTEEKVSQYLNSLDPNVLRIDNVFEDISKDYFVYGTVTGVIRYHGEVVGYVKRSGRELLGTKFFMKDYDKYTALLENVVDNCRLRDMMRFTGAILVKDGMDVDEFLPVPNLTKHEYGD